MSAQINWKIFSLILVINLLLGNFILHLLGFDVSLNSLNFKFSFIAVPLLLIAIFFLRRKKSLLFLTLLAFIVTLAVPIFGLAIDSMSLLKGLLFGSAGFIAFWPYWIPMFVLNSFLLWFYQKSVTQKY